MFSALQLTFIGYGTENSTNLHHITLYYIIITLKVTD